MLGINCKWECPQCGNVLGSSSPFWNKELRKKLSEPIKCGCGRKKDFVLIDFERCEFRVEKKEA